MENKINKNYDFITGDRHSMSPLEKNIMYMIFEELGNNENKSENQNYMFSIQEIRNKMKEMGKVVNRRKIK
jgi:hypothetical protein